MPRGQTWDDASLLPNLYEKLGDRAKTRPGRRPAMIHVGCPDGVNPENRRGELRPIPVGNRAKLLLERCESGRIGLTANQRQAVHCVPDDPPTRL